MKKVLLSILLTFLPLLAGAEPVEIDGIWYNLVKKIKEAEVVKYFNSYVGDIIIPSTVTYENVEYNVTSIGLFAFRNCEGLTSITIPNSITYIDSCAFEYSNNLNSVFISDLNAWCNTNIRAGGTPSANHLYLEGKEIKNLIIPDGVISIKRNTFKGFSGLTSVTIPNSVTSIGNSAFGGCSSLTSITIPNSVTSIGDGAFWGCSSLTSVTIPSNITSIGDFTFEGCSALPSVTIPSSVTSIGTWAFAGCNNLASVNISDLTAWCNIKFNDNESNPLCYAHHLYYKGNEITNLVIPNSITSIGSYTFTGCSGLATVSIPNSVTSIGGSAFSGCSGLTSVSIPSSVKTIEEYAFAKCEEMTDVYCFAEKLSQNNWWGHEGLYAAPSAFFESYPQVMILHVPVASVDEYRSMEPWSQFKTIVTLETGEIPIIPKCATPEISYANGEIFLSCETEGVEFVSEVTVADAKKYYDSEFTLSQTYKITVYATKAGYENSDVATREIVVEKEQTSLFGDLDKDGKVNVADHVKLSDIILNK